MPHSLRFWLVLLGWCTGVTLLHLGLNTRIFESGSKVESRALFRVGFLPVT